MFLLTYRTSIWENSCSNRRIVRKILGNLFYWTCDHADSIGSQCLKTRTVQLETRAVGDCAPRLDWQGLSWRTAGLFTFFYFSSFVFLLSVKDKKLVVFFICFLFMRHMTGSLIMRHVQPIIAHGELFISPSKCFSFLFFFWFLESFQINIGLEWKVTIGDIWYTYIKKT